MNRLPFVAFITLSVMAAPDAGSAQNAPPCAWPSQYAIEIFDEVLKETRKAPQNANIQVELCKSLSVPNAYALPLPIYQTTMFGQQLIGFKFSMYYNPLFMGQLDVSRNNKWAQYGVFAHELGHFMQVHNNMEEMIQRPWNSQFQLTQPWSKELFADRHAGKILAQMGAGPKDIEEAQRFMFTLHGTPTHPSTTDRLVALYEGYREGGGNSEGLPTPEQISKDIFDKVTRW